METYTAMRHFADSWGLLAMAIFFVGVVLFTLRPGVQEPGQGRCRNPSQGGLRDVGKTY